LRAVPRRSGGRLRPGSSCSLTESKGPPEELSSADLSALVAEKQDELEQLKAQLQEALEREEAEAQQEQDRAANAELAKQKREEAQRLLAEAEELDR
jgi:hypothetical protein